MARYTKVRKTPFLRLHDTGGAYVARTSEVPRDEKDSGERLVFDDEKAGGETEATFACLDVKSGGALRQSR